MMKRFCLLAGIAVACFGLFVACDSNSPDTGIPYVKYGWDNFPYELVDSYFPSGIGDELTYLSDKGDTIVFSITSKSATYAERPRKFSLADGGWTTASEHYYVEIQLQAAQSNNHNLPTSLWIAVDDDRTTALWRLNTSGMWFEYDANRSNTSTRPDAIFQYLADSISLTAHYRTYTGTEDLINAALIVRGRGLVQFTEIRPDEQGYFQETGDTWHFAGTKYSY